MVDDFDDVAGRGVGGGEIPSSEARVSTPADASATANTS